jgi:hypothetical protein
MSSVAPPAPHPRQEFRRYRTMEALASGGMGTVFRSEDVVTGETVALKRLLPHLRDDARAIDQLQREYRTLAQLRHPRIIRVFHYGVDDEGPYYTMELLERSDLRDLAPQSWQPACRHLRDVAGSIALLHARRLLHRDVSPRNARLTRQGRPKLIDFGALADFGRQQEVVGTPPCIAPEALHGEPLDQRSDLYSLGALAYFLLTGRHAYPAHKLSELQEAWKHVPPPPSAHESEVPLALDALVMSLLSHDPLGRPSSAAEVIDRLNAIAELSPDVGAESWVSYLHDPVLVGRQRELERLRLRVKGAVTGQEGCAVVVEGVRGVGRTRLLREVGIEAELAGATIVRCDAEAYRDPYGLARAVVDEIVRGLPEVATELARPFAPVFARLQPKLQAALNIVEMEPLPQDPAEQRTRLQKALSDWLRALTAHHPLVLCIDNVQAADEASLAWLAVLARSCSDRRLAIIATLRTGEPPLAAKAVQALRDSAHRKRLHNLERREGVALMEAMFGDAPHLGRLSQWMHEQAGGNPLHMVELARFMVDQGVIRYVEGGWSVPSSMEGVTLPASLDDVLAARLAPLSQGAREMAGLLSLMRGAFDATVAVALPGTDDEDQVRRHLDELVAQEVLKTTNEGYGFRQELLRAFLERQLPDEVRRATHLRLGEHMLGEADEADHVALLEAGGHLLRGGDETKGAEVLMRAAGHVWRRPEGLVPASAAFEAALAVFEREKRHPLTQAAALTATAVAGWYADRRLMERHGDRAVALTAEITGIARARRLAPKVGHKLGLLLGVGTAAVTHPFKRHHLIAERRSFREMFVNLFSCAAARIGVAAVALDAAPIERTLEQLAPLSHFRKGQIAPLMYRYFEHLRWTTRGREDLALEVGRQVHRELDDPKWLEELDEDAHRGLLSGLLLGMGIIETQRDVGAGLAYADRLEEIGLLFYRGAAAQLRMLHHAYRGEMGPAHRYQQEAETVALQGGSTWQTDIFVAIMMNKVHQAAGNVMGIKQAAQALQRWADEIPSLQDYADSSMAAYMLERGRLAEAIDLYEALLPRLRLQRPGWADGAGMYGQALLAAGRASEAREVLEAAVADIHPEQRQFVINYLEPERVLAMAEARCGDADQAQRRLNALLEERSAHCGPLTVGSLHEAQAWVALEAGDRLAFEHHLRCAEQLFHGTANPSLVAKADRLAAAGEERFASRVPAVRPADSSPPTARDGISAERIRSMLDACRGADERAAVGLDALVRASGAAGGYFFLLEGSDLRLAAQTSAEEPASEVAAALHRLADGLRSSAGERTETLSQAPEPEHRQPAQGSQTSCHHLVLHTHFDSQPVVVGAAALFGPRVRAATVPFDLVDAIARSFFDAGDVSS